MSTYARPSFAELLARIQSDFAAMPAVLRTPLAAAWARACNGEHAHLEWLYDQMTPMACDEDRLVDWATLYGVPRLDAVAASGQVTFAGSVGAALLAQTQLRGANGVDYAVQQAVTLSGTSGTVTVTALSAGAAGNLAAGAELTLIDPVPGIAEPLTVAVGGLGGGADQEGVEQWRVRVVEQWVELTTVGARAGRKNDYVYWAKAAHPSVTGALVQLHALGIGTVLVRPICNGQPNRLPDAAVLQAVLAYTLSVAPAMPDISVAAPALRAVPITIDLAAGVDTTGNRAAIAVALTDLVLSKQSDGAVIMPSDVDAAVATVTTQYARITPTANIVAAEGEVLNLPVITWA